MVKNDHDAIGQILKWMKSWVHNSYIRAGQLRYEARDADSEEVRDQKMAMAREIEKLLDEPNDIYMFLVSRYPDLEPPPIHQRSPPRPRLAIDNTKKTPGKAGHQSKER